MKQLICESAFKIIAVGMACNKRIYLTLKENKALKDDNNMLHKYLTDLRLQMVQRVKS